MLFILYHGVGEGESARVEWVLESGERAEMRKEKEIKKNGRTCHIVNLPPPVEDTVVFWNKKHENSDRRN